MPSLPCGASDVGRFSFRGIQRQRRLPCQCRCTWTPPHRPWGRRHMMGGRQGHQACARKAELGAHTQGDRCLLQARIPSPQLGACGGTYTSPDIPTGPASPLPAALQLVEQRDDLSSPCAAQRVAQGHCTPQRVHLLRGEFQLLHTVHSLGGGGALAVDPSLVPFAPSPLAPTGDPRPRCKTKAHLTGKGLVDLKDVHVVHRQPCRPGGKT